MRNIYNIKTEAGKTLWEKMNQNYGSSVWGQVGEGIEAIEAEVEERIIKMAWDWISEMRGHDGECSCRHDATILQQFIEHSDFKGENK